MESKTPINNENEKLLEMLSGIKIISHEYVSQLETELADKDRRLAEARAEIERLKNQLEDESMRADGMTTAHAEAGADNYRMRELIEQMREALNVLVASATPSGPLWHGSAEMQIARAALLAAERGRK